MDRILVVCDFRSECVKAIEKAINLAEKNSVLFLLYLVSGEYCKEVGKKGCRATIKNLKKRVKEKVEEIKERGFKCRSIIKIGELVGEISKQSKKYGCTFIVIEYGSGGVFHQYTIEGISDEIINITSLPVMVVS